MSYVPTNRSGRGRVTHTIQHEPPTPTQPVTPVSAPVPSSMNIVKSHKKAKHKNTDTVAVEKTLFVIKPQRIITIPKTSTPIIDSSQNLEIVSQNGLETFEEISLASDISDTETECHKHSAKEKLINSPIAPSCCTAISEYVYNSEVEQKTGVYRSNSCTCFKMTVMPTTVLCYDIIVCWYVFICPYGVSCLWQREYDETNHNYYKNCCVDMAWNSNETVLVRSFKFIPSSTYSIILPRVVNRD